MSIAARTTAGIVASLRARAIQIRGDNLRQNYLNILTTSGASVLLGFVFWAVAAHLYTASDVGLATSAVSAAALLSGIGVTGFHTAMIRFLDGATARGRYVGTALMTTTVLALAVTACFFIVEPTLLPRLHFLRSHVWDILLFGALVLALTAGAVIDGAIIALQKTRLLIVKALIGQPIRFSALLILGGMGASGIVLAQATLLIAGAVLGLAVVRLYVVREPLRFDLGILRAIRSFALANFIGDAFGMAMGSIIPLIVLARLGAVASAHFYLPMLIVGVLPLITMAAAQSFVSEASASPERARPLLFGALKNAYLLLVPVALALMAIGPFLLRVLGTGYATEGTAVLEVLTLASLIGAINVLGGEWLNVHHRLRARTGMSGLRAAGVFIAVYVLAPKGLVWVGVGSLIGQSLSAGVFLMSSGRLFAPLSAEL